MASFSGSQAKHPHYRLTACRLGHLWLECQVGHHSVAAAYDVFLDGNRMVFVFVNGRLKSLN